MPIKFLPYAEFYKDKVIYSCIDQSVSNALSAGDKNMTKSKKKYMKKYNNGPNLES